MCDAPLGGCKRAWYIYRGLIFADIITLNSFHNSRAGYKHLQCSTVVYFARVTKNRGYLGDFPRLQKSIYFIILSKLNESEYMETSLDCIPCMINSFLHLLKNGMLPGEKQVPAMQRLLSYLATADLQKSPPALAREMHHIIREELDNPDPYYDIKKHYNSKMMDMLPRFSAMVEKANDPFDMALRLAMAGNVIDFGPQNRMDIMETIDRVVDAEFGIDDSQQLRDDVAHAENLLYIGDNCGEIVLDRLFMQTINHPRVTFVVRGGPAINDALMEDAEFVGMDKLAAIITTGDNAPGAVWETASDEFRRAVKSADVVISKGQGNLEALMDVDANIYFLLVAKCDLIASRIGAKTGDFIVKRQRNV